MSLVQEQTKNALIEFSRRFGPAAIVPANVLSVNDDDTVHIKFSDEAEVEDCRLKSVVKDGNKFLLIPKVGSVVQVAKIENSDEYIVVAVEEITEAKCIIDNVQWSIDARGFFLKKDNDTLKGLVDDLFTAILNERHETNTGVTINLTPDSIVSYNNLKTRFDNFFR